MLKSFVLSGLLMSCAIGHSQTSEATRELSQQKLRASVSEIPLNLNSCLARVDLTYFKYVDKMYCDGKLVFDGTQILFPTSMFERPTYHQSLSLFVGVMLEFGFELKAAHNAHGFENLTFQRTRRFENFDSKTF